MSELLTTKQMQEILKIDRITVYRMLDDGRLKGVKIGNQWRFPESEIDRLLGEDRGEEEAVVQSVTDFPSGCVQEVQEIFAGIIGIGAITVSMGGEPLTEPTFSNPFCQLMLSSPLGRHACQHSWRRIAMKSTGEANFQICHAGLCYKRAIINMDELPVAWLIAGQYYLNTPDHEIEKERVEQLAIKYQIPVAQLQEAALKIPILKHAQQKQVQEWTPKVANTVQSILCERSDLMSRLQRIAELSSVKTTLSNNINQIKE
jgi:excisionase family DNA binding protein